MASPLLLSASSTIGSKEDKGAKIESSGLVGETDLLIVGPGVLGRLVANKWREENPGCQIVGETVTEDHHEELRKLGIYPTLRGTQLSQRYPYVIFCAPPYRTVDYPADVREAAVRWNGEGCFLFTSSSAPYDCHDNGECDEDTPVVPIGRSLRTDVLLKAEKVALESEGSVDAASLCITILKKKLRGQILLGCDNHPLSRQEIMDLVAKSGKFSRKFEGFTGTSDPLGKKLNNWRTRKLLSWEPNYPSFAHFLDNWNEAVPL
ncbi:hypothetical protein LINPERHAP2_LOCUS25587 [Linum perenne]